MKFSLLTKILVSISIIAVAGFGIFKNKHSHDSDQRLNWGEVKRQTLLQRVTISGQVWPKKRLDIKPPFNGYIVKIYAKVGDRLKYNMPIVTFSPSLSAGETNFPIRAGFEGVVTQLLKSEGEYVAETGDQNLVMRVEDLSELYVLGSVPELDIAKLKLGQEALIHVSSLVGESFKGKITEIGLSAKTKDNYSSASTEFQIKVAIDSHDPRLLPGLSCIMDVIANKRENVLTLAHEYIQEDEGGYFITAENGQKKAIKLGLQTDEAAEVLSGLTEGEKVRPIDFLNLPALKN